MTEHVWKYSSIPEETKYSMATFAILFMYVKLIYWFRLFSVTSFYIRLIVETIIDIGWFFTILLTILLMYSNGFYMMNLYRIETEGSTELIERHFSNNVVNTIISQYLLLLGEFADFIALFSNNPNSTLAWMMFAGTTFIT